MAFFIVNKVLVTDKKTICLTVIKRT